MKVSKKSLVSIIESYLHEKDRENKKDKPEESSSKDDQDDLNNKIEKIDINFQIKNIEVKITGESDGGLCLTIFVPGKEEEKLPSIDKEDIAKKSENYINFILKLSQHLSALRRENREKAAEYYKHLVEILGSFEDVVNHRQSIIAFDKNYTLKDPSDTFA